MSFMNPQPEDNTTDAGNGESMADAMNAELARHGEEMSSIMENYGVTPDEEGEGSQED
jgi:hypothetical protein